MIFQVSPPKGSPYAIQSDGYMIHPSGALLFTMGSGDNTQVSYALSPQSWESIRPIPQAPQQAEQSAPQPNRQQRRAKKTA